MKKKAIEKIPYLGLKRVSRKKDCKYIGVTAVKIIGHERHLLLEVYKNDKSAKDVPEVRIALTKKDFGTYTPEDGKWSRRLIKSAYLSDGLVWEGTRGWRSYQQVARENILYDPKDLERIQKFTKIKIYDTTNWWDYIEHYESHIAAEERNKAQQNRYERRMNALKDREKNTKPLPEDKILENVDMMIFHEKHYLYYKKHGSHATIACSKCGGVTDARWKAGTSYESEFERWTQEPREGAVGTCPLCGATGEYKCQGKVKHSHEQISHIFLGQKYKESGVVMRYVEVSKEWQLQFICGDKGPEMFNALETISGAEIARAYFEPGKSVQIDYHKHNPYSGRDFWDDCNLSGLHYIPITSGYILQETFEELKGTIFQYSGLEQWLEHNHRPNPIDYLEAYQRTPQIEMLTKLKLYGVVQSLVKSQYGIVADEDATRPDKFLGIRKDQVGYLIEKEGNIETLEVLQMEKRMRAIWPTETIEKLIESGVRQAELENVLQYISINKLLNAIEKYAGCTFGTDCTSAAARIKHTARTYVDYLQMRAARGYDMTNGVYLRPRDLETAHNKMVQETNQEKQSQKLKEVAEKYPMIRKKYRTLRKKYYYEDDTYLIRPARSAEEIVTEGQVLHHCVGGDNYLRSHNEQQSIILFLRFKDQPETPYVTVEIKGGHIRQWYGAYDRKPDKENLDHWLNEYMLQLNCGGAEWTTMQDAG